MPNNAAAFKVTVLGDIETRVFDTCSLVVAMTAAGESIDSNGQRAFVMVLRTREQDIRREKATSNICTNQGLNALAACVYMAALGKNGLRRVAELCLHKAHYLADEINKIPGFEVSNQHFFNEFTVKVPGSASALTQAAAAEGLFPGVSLKQLDEGSDDRLLVAVTEKRSRADLDKLMAFLKGYSL